MAVSWLTVSWLTLVQGWVGGVIVTLAVVVAGGVWCLRPRRSHQAGLVLAAGLDRVRALPGFRALVRRERRLRLAEVACLGAGLVGAALLASRWVGVDDDSPEMRNRDVVLCMDVSASMAPVVSDVLDTYVQLTDTLDGERLGFVMFDGNAVTGFPLTDDYAYVRSALLRAGEEIHSGQVAGTAAARSGTSLIPDGLVSCVQHFDRADEERSRTIVLATDNLVSGESIYSLEQAIDHAVEAQTMVFGIVPVNNKATATAELREQSARTDGDTLLLDPGTETNTVVISEAITSQQKRVIVTEARQQSFDRVWPGGLLLALGLLGSLATRGGRR